MLREEGSKEGGRKEKRREKRVRQRELRESVQLKSEKALDQACPFSVVAACLSRCLSSLLPVSVAASQSLPLSVASILCRFHSLSRSNAALFTVRYLQSALFNFQSLLMVILLLICTCAYIHERMPSLLDNNKKGFVRVLLQERNPCMPSNATAALLLNPRPRPPTRAPNPPPSTHHHRVLQDGRHLLEVCPHRCVLTLCFAPRAPAPTPPSAPGSPGHDGLRTNRRAPEPLRGRQLHRDGSQHPLPCILGDDQHQLQCDCTALCDNMDLHACAHCSTNPPEIIRSHTNNSLAAKLAKAAC